MNRKSLILGLLAILGVSVSGAVLTNRISSQNDVILELRDIQQKLEEENENLSDQLQSCTEDYQHCISGRIWTESYPNPFNK